MADLFKDEYKVVGRYKPFKHQTETVNFLIQHPNAFVFNEIGTGKTAALIWAADVLKNIGCINKVLIVAPLSTLKNVWADALFDVVPHRRSIVVHGSKASREKKLTADVDFYILNHDGIKVMFDELNARDDIDHVIVDESSIFRGARTDKFLALKKLCKKKTIWCATGSPTPNSPTDIWATASIVCPKNVPKYFTHFKRMTMYQVSQFIWKPKGDWQDTIQKLIHPAIRFTRDECLDLPPVIYETRSVALSSEQTKLYNQILKTYQAEVKSAQITALNEAAKRIKLLQIISGAVYDDTKEGVVLDCKHRLNVLGECLEECKYKAIVFVPFKNIQKLIQEFVATKLKRSCAIVNGETSLKDRSDMFHNFQINKLDVLIAHPKCMGYGLDLTASSTIIWWSPIDDCDVYMQANGRITRPSQKNKQLIIHFSSTKLEDMIYNRLKEKQAMQNVLLEYIEDLRKKKT